MKKILSLLFAVIILASSLCLLSYGVGQAYMGVTTAKTPINNVSLLFSKKFGGNYKAAPTPPVVVGDTVLLVSGVKLYKLNAETGEEIASVKMEGSTLYTTVSPLYADGKIFVSLDEGIVQAFDYKTMKSLWVYTDKIGGQALLGYVRAYKPDMKMRDYELYRGIYCSLCRALGRNYSPLAQLFLSYDFALACLGVYIV